MARTKWLDGLRGIAAAIVAFDHLFMSDVWHPFVSFWNDPPEMNRHIVQLPPIRILFSAHAMVTLFMVISGYAISIGILKDQNTPQFLPKVSSAIVRRIFRIYLPVLVTASLAQFLYFFNLFHWNFDENFLASLPKPWSTPWSHITYVFGFLAETLNIVSFRYPGSLNGQLWTMPIEFRGSNIVYLLIVGLSTWRLRMRLFVLPVIAAFFWWYGNWDVFGFIWGLWFAQRAAGAMIASDEDHDSEFEMEEFDGPKPISTFSFSTLLPRLGSLFSGRYRYSSLNSRNCITFSRVAPVLALVVGFHLLCLGNDAHLSPGYKFLSFFQPAHWKDEWDLIHMCWKAIGAIMLVYAIGEFPALQRPLNARIPQYLGKISFALYLLHETVYQLWRNPMRDVLFLLLSGEEYGDSARAVVADPFAFHVTWWTTGALLGAVVLCAAHYYTIYIDNPCVVFAKKVDRWFSS